MIPQVTAAALVSREQAARLSGERRFDPDLGQPGRPCLDGRARRPPAAADGRERRRRHRHRAARRRAGLRLPRAADIERRRSRRCAPCSRAEVPHLDDDRHLPSRHGRRRSRWSRSGALVGAAGAMRCLIVGARRDEPGRHGSTVRRGDGAAAGQPAAYRHRSPPTSERRLVVALARAHGYRLVDRPALRLRRRPRRDGGPHGAFAHRHRRQPRSRPAPRSIRARRRPSSARPTTFDGEPLYASGEEPDAAEIAAAARALSSTPIMRRSRPRSRGCAPSTRTSSSTTAIRSARSSRACSTARCRTSTSAPMTARAARPACRRPLTAICAARRFSHVVNGRFKGGWITRHYGRPERRRPCAPDGARLPRLSCDEPLGPVAEHWPALRRGPCRADARRACADSRATPGARPCRPAMRRDTR